ncbi:MAG TPA: M36 family metallopeptidase [Mycobacteriales bacterium]
MRRRHVAWLALPLSFAALVAPSSDAAVRARGTSIDVLRPGFQGEDSLLPQDVDNRAGSLRPTAQQVGIARRLGAKARWNEFGTPSSLFNRTAWLSAPKKGDPVAIARAWVKDNAALFRLTPALTAAGSLELVANNPLYESTDNRRRLAGLEPLAKDDTLPHVVMFRQSYAGVDAGAGGLLTVTLDRQNRVTYVSSSVSGDTRVTNKASLTPARAWQLAAADLGWHTNLADLKVLDTLHRSGFTQIQVPGTKELQLARLRAVPTPRDGVRLAYEVDVMNNELVGKAEPLGFISFVDAETGRVLTRQNAVQHFSGGGMPSQVPIDPRWKVFPNTPPLAEPGVKADDTREVWCWVEGNGCQRVVGGTAFPRTQPQLKFPWDVVPADANQGAPSNTSLGNDADTQASYVSHLTPDVVVRHALPPTEARNYDYAFTDVWHTSNCFLSRNYAPDQNFNDVDAAIMNLFVMYGRMHDWAYNLGFTESTWNMQTRNFGEDTETTVEPKDGDPEVGQAQAGAVAGSVAFTGRDNANQRTMQDGVPGVTNQYLWHPLQAGFYSPCVDGAFDMTVVAHEYTHAISNRMIGGPDANIGGTEGPKMGESWSDLAAMEYINGYGFTPVGNENPFAVGPYATGSPQKGIRNYGMNDSPLNYSNLGYDGNGATSPHADGEIWSAANFAVRQALVEKWNAKFPYTDKALQYACAEGFKDVNACPGNRRWIQNMFDGFLIQDAAAGMPAAAEAQIAADRARNGGPGKPNSNEKEMWEAFASRGMGDLSDEGGTPDWTNPLSDSEVSVRFQAVPVAGGGVPAEMFVYVGHYSARATEAAVAKAGLQSPVRKMVPGTYDFVARADGYGMYRFRATIEKGMTLPIKVPMRKNVASTTNGAEASGDGGNFEKLIDDSEETNWAYLGASTDEDIEGKQVTVDLAGDQPVTVASINVSAINRPQESNDAYDKIGQNRFAALRSFVILVCDASTGADCDSDDSYQVAYTSPEDAFPSIRPRPTSPNLIFREFDIPGNPKATHVRLQVVTNQCTGNPIFTREENPVAEPASDPDCVDGLTAATLVDTDPDPDDPPPLANNTQKHRVRAAELQVFSTDLQPQVVPPRDKPPVVKPPVVKPPVKPSHPVTGLTPALPIAALLMAAAAAVAIRRRRTV